MKLIKKLFGIKTTYAIPSDNGVDITKGKKYKCKVVDIHTYLKDDANVKIVLLNDLNFIAQNTNILVNNCKHINGGNWKIITE